MQEDLTTLNDMELQRLRKKYEADISRHKNMQLAKKVQLNAAYGALG